MSTTEKTIYSQYESDFRPITMPASRMFAWLQRSGPPTRLFREALSPEVILWILCQRAMGKPNTRIRYRSAANGKLYSFPEITVIVQIRQFQEAARTANKYWSRYLTICFDIDRRKQLAKCVFCGDSIKMQGETQEQVRQHAVDHIPKADFDYKQFQGVITIKVLSEKEVLERLESESTIKEIEAKYQQRGASQ